MVDRDARKQEARNREAEKASHSCCWRPSLITLVASFPSPVPPIQSAGPSDHLFDELKPYWLGSGEGWCEDRNVITLGKVREGSGEHGDDN